MFTAGGGGDGSGARVCLHCFPPPTNDNHNHTVHYKSQKQPFLEKASISAPSPIQEAAIPAVLAGANCAIQSYTGSGKVNLV